MKLNKLAMATAIGLASIGGANAACTTSTATHIYITGSTAFRGAAVAAIEASLNPGFSYTAYKESASFAPYATARQTAGYANYYGTLVSDGSCVVIKTAWSGSEAGYQDMVKCTSQKESFMDDAVGGFGGFGATSADSTSTPATTDSHLVDITMSDTSQPFAKVASRTPVIANICRAGIIPFVWVKNAQTAADIAAHPEYNDLKNVTHPQLRVAILNSGSKLSLFTGVASENKYVYVAGRDNNSGTRANALLDIGLPVTQALVGQTIIGGASGAPTLGALGNAGQSSGGTLGNTMLYTGSAVAADSINGGTGWYAIAYMGKPDAITREAQYYTQGPALIELTLNGVAESDNAIEQGQYSYWGQEYCALANCDTLSSEAGVLWTTMCSKFPTSITAGLEIPMTAMQATKTPDSADPIHN